MKLEVRIKKKLGDFEMDIEFAADSGVLALLGASGSGKSMTLKCIAGIETPDEGRIVLDGRVLFDSVEKVNLSPQKRNVGYLFQQYALFPNMTSRQNIECAIKGNRKERKAAADALIGSMYLEGLAHKYPYQLSGGQQQRVALARILASTPEMILLDEPFSALDSYLQWQLEMELMDTLAAFGGLTLFVSHSRDEVYRVCDSVCVINDGRSESVISVPELFGSPGTISAALLSGCKNYSHAEKTGERAIYASDWGVELITAVPVPEAIQYIGIRSHYVRPAAGEDKNVLKCSVIRVTHELFETSIMLRPDRAAGSSGYSNIRMDLPKAEWERMGNPESLDISISSGDILLLR